MCKVNQAVVQVLFQTVLPASFPQRLAYLERQFWGSIH